MSTADEFVLQVAERLGCSRHDAAETIAIILATLVEQLATTGEVRLRKFGTFRVSESHRQLVYNPRSQTTAPFAKPRLRVRFLPSDTFLRAIADRDREYPKQLFQRHRRAAHGDLLL